MLQRIHILRKLLQAVLLSVIAFSCIAQDKYGFEWAAGGYPIIAKASQSDFANTAIGSSVIYLTSACISDSSGTLQFYTNGARVFTKDGLVMKNGDSLTFNKMWNVVQQSGMASYQGAIILPHPGNSYWYWIFHFSSVDTTVMVKGIAEYIPNRLLYSIVDMRGDSGRGEVVVKDEVLIDGISLDPSRMTACKHANGRDWWIIKNSYVDSNLYYKFLLSDKGWSGAYIQSIGTKFLGKDGKPLSAYGQAVFSEDGTKYATISGRGNIVLMDFDRCNGEFSNPVEIPNYYADFDVSGGMGIAFSPNGRFLYANNRLELNQYDLWKQDIDSVRIHTGVYSLNDPIDPGGWMMSCPQLAPNGKIYLSTYNGGIPALHVIHQPDSFGLACNFVPFGQQVNTINATSLPNMPNYRLGKLEGSPCDTIVASAVAPSPSGRVGVGFYPNPANSFVVVYLKEYAPDVMLTVLDVTGKKIHQQNMHLETSIDVSSYASGVYFVRVESKGKLIGVSKLMKE